MRREITFGAAIREALFGVMRLVENSIIIGQLVDRPNGIFGTTHGLIDEFGPQRVVDFPIAESLMTSLACGAAASGLRPIIVHQRFDFALYSLDALINWIALWRFKSGGHDIMPILIRVIIGRGWGQGPQHSKNFYNWFASIPGFNVLMPTTAFEAKGLFIEAALKNDPCIFVENRSLYNQTAEVPESMYRLSYDYQNVIAKQMSPRLTICFFGDAWNAVIEAIEAAGMQAEADVIALPIISPFPMESVKESVSQSGRLIIVEPLWNCGAMGHKIISELVQAGVSFKSPPRIVSHPDSFVPMATNLENDYYISKDKVSDAITQSMS
jgi:pyruvate dehydrogenase E1 component beta subunit